MLPERETNFVSEIKDACNNPDGNVDSAAQEQELESEEWNSGAQSLYLKELHSSNKAQLEKDPEFFQKRGSIKFEARNAVICRTWNDPTQYYMNSLLYSAL